MYSLSLSLSSTDTLIQLRCWRHALKVQWSGTLSGLMVLVSLSRLTVFQPHAVRLQSHDPWHTGRLLSLTKTLNEQVGTLSLILTLSLSDCYWRSDFAWSRGFTLQCIALLWLSSKTRWVVLLSISVEEVTLNVKHAKLQVTHNLMYIYSQFLL